MPSAVTSQRTSQEGADSAVYCAICDDDTAAAFSGRFVRDRHLFNPAKGQTSLTPFAKIFLWALAKTHAEDDRTDEAAKRIWDLSQDMVDGKVCAAQCKDKRTCTCTQQSHKHTDAQAHKTSLGKIPSARRAKGIVAPDRLLPRSYAALTSAQN